MLAGIQQSIISLQKHNIFWNTKLTNLTTQYSTILHATFVLQNRSTWWDILFNTRGITQKKKVRDSEEQKS